jgi:hypothetical protein
MSPIRAAVPRGGARREPHLLERRIQLVGVTYDVSQYNSCLLPPEIRVRRMAASRLVDLLLQKVSFVRFAHRSRLPRLGAHVAGRRLVSGARAWLSGGSGCRMAESAAHGRNLDFWHVSGTQISDSPELGD